MEKYLIMCEMPFASLAISDQELHGIERQSLRQVNVFMHPTERVVRWVDPGCFYHWGYRKTWPDSKWTVTWKIYFCRGPDRPSFQTLTQQSCWPRCWLCRCHFLGICSCNRLHLKEKTQNQPRLTALRSFKVDLRHCRGITEGKVNSLGQSPLVYTGYKEHLRWALTHISSLETINNMAR